MRILGADIELLGQVLDADTLGDRDFAGDGQRLAAVLHSAIARRRHKALHRAFFGLGILLGASAAASGGGAGRARGLAGWRRGAAGTRGTTEAARPGCSKARARGKTRTRAGRAGSASSGVSAGSGARRMLGAWAAGELAGGCSRAAGSALRIAARTAGRPVAVEDGLAALNACANCLISGSGDRGGCNHVGRFVDGAWTGLGHDHAAGRQCRGGRCGVRVALGSTR